MKYTTPSFLCVPVLALMVACATSTPPRPTPAPEVPVTAEESKPVAEQAEASPDSEEAAGTATTESDSIVRDTALSTKLLEEGRTIQRERGEGGAGDAILKYRASIEADPQCAACYWELGWSQQVQNDWEACVQSWDHVRAINPTFPELDTHYPIALMRRDQAKALAALPEASELPEPETEPRDGPTLSIRAVGDVQLGRAWPEHRAKLPPNDAMDMFQHVRDDLQNADITFGNLETVLMDKGDSTKCGPRSTKCFAFRVPTSYAKALKDAGFDVMSIANNHTGDFGEPGRKTAIEALDAVGIHHSGPVGDIASFEKNGLRIGLIAFSTGGGVYRVQEIEVARRVVGDLARKHDLVIVSFHGGAEGSRAAHVPQGVEMFLGENRGDLRAFTHAVIDAGADLVLGHGPHLLRGMELYKGRLIAYSLGNFCTWETFSLRGPLGITGILDVKLAANGVLLETSLLPGKIKDPGRPRPDKKAKAIGIVRKLSKKDFGKSLLDKKGRYVRAKTAPRS